MRLPRGWVVWLVFLIACAPNPTRPATALRVFDQAGAYLKGAYYGFSGIDLATLVTKRRSALEKACASGCGPELAYPQIEGVLEELADPHSFFEDPDQADQTRSLRAGGGVSYPTIGVRWVYREASNAYLITEVAPNKPAQQAGLSRGDLVVGLNAQALPKGREPSYQALSAAIRSGQNFSLNVSRAGLKRSVALAGRKDNFGWVPSRVVPKDGPLKNAKGLFVLRIPDFDSPSVAQGVHALVTQAQNAQASKLIVDLRGNPGGILIQCIGAEGALLGSLENFIETRQGRTRFAFVDGVAFTQEGNGSRDADYRIANPARFTGAVALLVDADTASCGENFAANMQLRRRAVVVGEETYGVLNTATNSFDLLDQSAITITTARMLREGAQPHAERVMPNIKLKENLDLLERQARDLMLEQAVRVLDGQNAVVTAWSKPETQAKHWPGALLERQ